MKENNIVLLDGGLGQEINRRSKSANAHPLWSVKVMHEEPDVVVSVHQDFITAGATVLTLNNYTASITRMTRHGMADQFKPTHKLAIELLKRAIENSGVDRESINCAGCLPPLAATYVAEEALSYSESYDQYCRLIEEQINGVDFFIAETISNITEARAAADALASFEQRACIALTLNDDQSNTLRSGETLQSAIEVLRDNHVDTLMLNCCFPESIDQAVPLLRDSKLVFGGYANGFTAVEAMAPGSTVDDLQARVDLPPATYTQHALKWIDAGASIVGGCCEIGPVHIAHLNTTLRDNGYEIVKFV